MDGYAVHAAATFNATESNVSTLTCIEQIHAGEVPGMVEQFVYIRHRANSVPEVNEHVFYLNLVATLDRAHLNLQKGFYRLQVTGDALVDALRSGAVVNLDYREELERVTKIKGTHAVLAPLIQRFLQG